MPDKPKFGISTDPEKTEKDRESFIKEAQKNLKQDSSESAPQWEPKQKSQGNAEMPHFGANSKSGSNHHLGSIFTLRPWWFWFKAYGVSIVGLIYWATELPTMSAMHNPWLILIPSFILFPFASAMLEEIGDQINLPVPRIGYIIFGSSSNLENGLGSCLMTPIVLAARFGVFLLEWLFSIILGIIGLIVMIVGLSKGA